MRHFAVVAVCLTACIGPLPAQSAERLLTSTRAGHVVLGMAVEALYSMYGRDNVKLVDLYGEGTFTPAVEIFLPGHRAVPIATGHVDKVCGEFRITRISTESPLLRTAEGLGVGSTVSDVRRLHPTAQFNREERPSLIVDKLQMTFATANDAFADSTRIVGVWSWATLPDSLLRCH